MRAQIRAHWVRAVIAETVVAHGLPSSRRTLERSYELRLERAARRIMLRIRNILVHGDNAAGQLPRSRAARVRYDARVGGTRWGRCGGSGLTPGGSGRHLRTSVPSQKFGEQTKLAASHQVPSPSPLPR
jgi:hypothetical protein